jgi:hypothetical protein
VVRTVRVRLELDRADYKQGLREAANDTRGFEAEVKTLGTSAERTGVELKDTGTTAKKLGDDTKQSTRNVTDLSRELESTRAKLRDLGDEYKRSGKIELDHYRSLSGELRKLEQAKRDLDKLSGNNGQGLLGGLLGKGLGGASGGLPAVGGLGSSLVTGIAAGAIAAAPAAGAAIAAAILAGLGTVGIGAGIALSLQDPRIQASAKQMGDYINARLHIDASSFQEPVLSALARLSAGFDRFEPRLQRIFAGLAPEVDALAQGIVGLIDEAGPGLEHAFAASGPMIHEIAGDLPALGQAVGFFFDRVAAGGPGAIAFFHDLATVTEGTLGFLGLLTEGLSKLYEISSKYPVGGLVQLLGNLNDGGDKAHRSLNLLHQDGQQAADTLNKVGSAAASAGLQATLSSDDFSKLSAQISATATTSDMLAAKMSDKVLNATLGLDQATLGFAESQSRLSDSMKQNGLQLDIATSKGQANREAILGVVGANIRNYDAMIAAGASATEAAIAYDANTASLEGQLRQAGLTQEAIDGLIGKYKGVPTNVDTQIATLGLTQAINGLSDLIRQINGIPDYKNITVNTTYTRSGEYGQQVPQEARGLGPRSYPLGSGGSSGFAKRYGGIVAYAKGGVRDAKMSLRTDYAARSGMVARSPTVLFGEGSGAEAFIPQRDVSDARGLALADTAARWHGGRVVPAGSVAGGGQVMSIEMGGRVELTLDGRKIGELLINDAEHGGTAMTTFIRRVASR